jgi:hypothetical protein
MLSDLLTEMPIQVSPRNAYPKSQFGCHWANFYYACCFARLDVVTNIAFWDLSSGSTG